MTKPAKKIPPVPPLSKGGTAARCDWDPWDIKAALGKRGYTLARIARENGLAATTPPNVFRVSYPRMERIIADILGVSPADIWPSRYRAKAA